MSKRKRKILFTTGIRSDFYIQDTIMSAVEEHPDLECGVIVTGAHLSKKLGYTIDEIKKKKYKIVGKINNLVISDKPSSRVKGAAIQLTKLIDIFEKEKPDIVIAPYDREEAIMVALAGVYMNIPVAHTGAGDNTHYNVDGIIRHSATKLSHIIFTSTKDAADRVLEMCEEKKRVYHVGSPLVDRFKNVQKISRREVGEYFQIDIKNKPLIVNLQHPVSNELKHVDKTLKMTMRALNEINLPTVIIYPNSDPGRNAMVKVIAEYKFNNKNVIKIKNIPELYFVNLMRQASVLVGNSSMGICEAPAIKLPVVNVGNRQTGRENAGNVIFVPHQTAKIVAGINKCLSDKGFRNKVNKCKNPYEKGNAGKNIANILAKIKIDDALINKRFNFKLN